MAKQEYFIEDCIAGMRSRIGHGSVDLVFADPPFNIGFNKKSSMYQYGISSDVEIYYEDGKTREEYIAWAGTWIAEARHALKKNGIFILMSGWNHVSYLEIEAHKAGFETLNHAIWHYEFGPQTKRKLVTSHYHYLILLNGRVKDNGWTFNKTRKYEEDSIEPKDLVNLDELDPNDLDYFSNIRRLTKKYVDIKHPCKLNEDVHVKFFKLFTNPGELVVDIFMGVGSSLVAARKTSRNYIGFEINPEYKPEIEKMIARRCGNERGKKVLDAFMGKKEP
jgi:site-specific DNA-methyltransferase (adenine-specific)